MNRWLVVLGALIIQVSLGAVYIWSVFQTPLKGEYASWTESQATLPAQIVLASFALAVILGGRIQDKLGPRLVASAGAIVLGAGLILAKYTGVLYSAEHPIRALYYLVGTFSVLGGIGIGLAYVCPIATCVKWFPDKRGLITGLAVAGFGAGAFFFAPLAKALINGGAYELLGYKLFELQKVGVFNTFMVLGIIFFIAVLLGAQVMINPPAGYIPAGWTPPVPATGTAPLKVDFSPTEMLKTPMFWILWITYFAGCTAGLQVIMKASPIWQSFKIPLFEDRPILLYTFNAVATAAAMGVAILAIFNSLGRIFWGKISDNIGRKTTLVLMFFLCGAAMLGLDYMRSYKLYLLGISIVGMCFGGFLALYPAVTADFFGTKNIGVNYGWMFTAYGAGGIVGPYLAASLMKVVDKIPYQAKDAAGKIVEKSFSVGNYKMAFVAAGIACLVAGFLVMAIKKPQKKAE